MIAWGIYVWIVLLIPRGNLGFLGDALIIYSPIFLGIACAIALAFALIASLRVESRIRLRRTAYFLSTLSFPWYLLFLNITIF